MIPDRPSEVSQKGRKRLVVFTRVPESGRVKTRLIPVLGVHGATALHRRLVLRTLRTAQAACLAQDVDPEIRFTGGDEEALHHWLGDHWFCRRQKGADLGERMAGAFADSFNEGAGATVIVGSDCPELNSEVLAEAFSGLESNRTTLGPADDGGYYLIGLSRPFPALFRNISWGTESVLGQTLEILARSGITASLLPKLSDIDRPEDLLTWRRILEKAEGHLNTISVIIPALNESVTIPAAMESAMRGRPAELIVADGGSVDATPELARKAGATVVFSKPGRARQMNAGAARAQGHVLLFLHADTLLPGGWAPTVSCVLGQPGVAAGAFRFRTAELFRGKRLLERATNWRSHRWQMPYGDQAIFLRRALFEELGGFSNLPIMEDYELVWRLRHQGRIVTAAQEAVTSGRRWQRNGFLRTTLVNQLMIAGYHLGVNPNILARFYRGRG